MSTGSYTFTDDMKTKKSQLLADEKQRVKKKVKRLTGLLSDIQMYEQKLFRDIESQLFMIEMRMPPSRKDWVVVNSLPTRFYLDEIITPILYQGLRFICKTRPVEPVNALAAFLMYHKDSFNIPRPKPIDLNKGGFDEDDDEAISEVSIGKSLGSAV